MATICVQPQTTLEINAPLAPRIVARSSVSPEHAPYMFAKIALVDLSSREWPAYLAGTVVQSPVVVEHEDAEAYASAFFAWDDLSVNTSGNYYRLRVDIWLLDPMGVAQLVEQVVTRQFKASRAKNRQPEPSAAEREILAVLP